VPAKFKLVRGKDGKKDVAELRLLGGNFADCKRKIRSASQGGATSKGARQLWGNGKGSCRTRGRFAAATVRGTWWVVEDRCDGTLTRVKRGIVEVSELRTGK